MIGRTAGLWGGVALAVCLLLGPLASAGPVEDVQKKLDDAIAQQEAIDRLLDYYKGLWAEAPRQDMLYVKLPNGLIVQVSRQTLADLLCMLAADGSISPDEMQKAITAAVQQSNEVKDSIPDLLAQQRDRREKNLLAIAALKRDLEVAKKAPPNALPSSGAAWRLKSDSPKVNPDGKKLVDKTDSASGWTSIEYELGETSVTYHYQLFNKTMNKMVEDFSFRAEITGLKQNFLKAGNKIEVTLDASCEFAVDAGRYSQGGLDLNWGGKLEKVAVEPEGGTSVFCGRTTDGVVHPKMKRTVTFEVGPPGRDDMFIEVSIKGIRAMRWEWEPMP